MRQLISGQDVIGHLITMDCLHATFESVELMLAAGADYLIVLKDNTSLQLEKIRAMNGQSPRVRRYREPLDKSHGRIEQRHIEALDIPTSRTGRIRPEPALPDGRNVPGLNHSHNPENSTTLNHVRKNSMG